MLFNSLVFAIFLPVVFILYWFVFRGLRSQSWLILVSSYLFYGWWDWRFLLLLLLTSSIDFLAGWKIGHSDNMRVRKGWLWVSIISNLGILGFFKYFMFFLDSISWLGSLFGHPIHGPEWNIILPVGISFYTFQSLSYTIDVYRRDIPPSNDALNFLAFVSFFPQLVAGPIVRAGSLLPQFDKPRMLEPDDVLLGMTRIISGLFKKIVIADNVAVIVDSAYAAPQFSPNLYLTLSVVLYAIQIYCDFAGYSDIAIGTARLFGFYLEENFRYPYFAASFHEFWRRWHISFSTWMRDYIYISLGGNRISRSRTYLNLMLTMLIGGLWHGASWTFVAWGGTHGLLLAFERFMNKSFPWVSHLLPRLLKIAVVFSLSCLTLVLVRSGSFSQAIVVYRRLFGIGGYSTYLPGIFFIVKVVSLVSLFMLAEVILSFNNYKRFLVTYKWQSCVALSLLSLLIVIFGAFSGNAFIYFQF